MIRGRSLPIALWRTNQFRQISHPLSISRLLDKNAAYFGETETHTQQVPRQQQPKPPVRQPQALDASLRLLTSSHVDNTPKLESMTYN